MNLIETLQWRYATKKMSGKPVAADKIERILEATRLAPTSSGLQPYEILVVTNPQVKAEIQKIAYNQQVVTGCSHLLVFAVWDHYTVERINAMFDLTNEIRGFKNEGWESYRQSLLSTYPKRDREENFQHAAKQAYIGFGIAITAAALEGVDSTPMEGFDASALDELLKLKEKGLRSAIMLPLGVRAEEGDWLVNLKKVRKSREDFITEIK
ncbi:MAG: NAD(P)H-dependent oxidoreductase [Chitinophagaceae bacterium]|nr:NAD(P)H-dependent oxidoreductase [Oligoflexus sp.]